MTVVQDLAHFATGSDWEDLSEDARSVLKIRVLDSLGCAIGALDGEPVRMVRRLADGFGGAPRSSLIGGGRTAPDGAALHNGALIRYLDFNDSYLAPGETCHPSDCIGAILAAAQDAGASGRDLLTAIAVSYQVQARLSDEAPVRARGFDHTVQLAHAVAAGVSRALRLDTSATANAVAIAATGLNALRVTRTGELSHWKGLAAPWAASGAALAAYLAREGVSGPPEVYEGNKGFIESIAGPFEIDWAAEDLERVTRTILKRYNAEIHSQSALEAAIELRTEHGLTGREVERVELEVFDVAYHIIGGGEEGEKTTVRTKEEADHSLQYMVAVALLDGQVLPAQYRPERILADDVQSLLRRVHVRPNDDYSLRFPRQHASRLRLHLADGRILEREKSDYEGFVTRPMRWETVADKFEGLAIPWTSDALRKSIMEAVAHLDEIEAGDLCDLLERVGRPGGEDG